jgi:putative flippase GtrA
MNSQRPKKPSLVARAAAHPAAVKLLEIARQKRSFLLYAVMGGTALLVELVLFYVMHYSLRQGLVASNAVAMGVGMLTSFTLNSRYTFKVNNRLAVRFLSFAAVSGCSYVLSTVMLLALSRGLSVPAFIAKILTLPVILLFQYNVNKRLTFHENYGQRLSGMATATRNYAVAEQPADE